MQGTTAYLVLHGSIVVIALIGVVCWVIIAKRHSLPYIFIASSLYLLNITAFSITRLLFLPIEPVMLNYWSLGIRLQGVITITGGGIFLLLDWWHHE